MGRSLTLVWGLLLIGAMGCGQAKPVAVEPSSDDVSQAAKKSNPPLKEGPATTPPPSVSLVATGRGGTAEAAFHQTLIAFQEGRLQDAFDFLPASHQTDVDQLLHLFADKMDTDLWSRSFELLGKVGRVLKSKKNLILDMDGVKRLPQIEFIKPHWDSIANGMLDLAQSELSDLQKLKHVRVRELLGSASQVVRGLPLPQFGEIQATTLKSDATTSTLSYREARSSEPRQVEFVLVDGKWLPKTIADGWAAGILDARSSLEQLPERMASWKPVVAAQLEKLEGMIDQLQASRTKEEFGAAAAPLIFTMAYGAQMAQQAMLESSSSSRSGNAVYCLINRELPDDELTKLKDVVVEFLGDDGTGAEYELIPNDGKTRCRFTMVSDAEALVALLARHFDKASVRLDLESRTIHVDFK